MKSSSFVETAFLILLVILLALQLWAAVHGIRGFAITPGAKIQECIEELQREHEQEESRRR